MQALLEAGHPALSEPAGDVLQRLIQRAAQLATIRRGQLGMVSGARLVATPLPEAPPGMQRAIQSPNGQHAALLDPGRLHVACLSPTPYHLSIQEALPSLVSAFGFTAVTGLLVVVDMRLADEGTDSSLESRVFNLGNGEWSAWATHGRTGGIDSRLQPELSLSPDDSLAACYLWGPSAHEGGPGSKILIVSLLDASVWTLFPAPHEEFMLLRWVPCRHLLLSIGTYGVLTVDVGPGLAHRSQLLAKHRHCLQTIVDLGIAETVVVNADADFHGARLSLAVQRYDPGQAPEAGLVELSIREPIATQPAGVSLSRPSLHSWTSRDQPHISSAGRSSALCCYQRARLCTTYQGSPRTFTVEGLTDAVWQPHDGHFVAGARGLEVVVLDRAGATVATFAPPMPPPRCAHEGPQALAVRWVGADCRQLAVQYGMGAQVNGVWESVLFMLLDFA